MADDHIKRVQTDPDGLDFSGLRGKGIALLQGLSRDAWTDYNLHDPGVTLLEMLCYGLTDLVYRTDFDVADFLTDESGSIDYHRQALFAPQDIFPNAPVTEIDFCKLIYDDLPQVDDVWIRTARDDGEASGLFRVYIKPHESMTREGESDWEQLRRDVIELLSMHRNLCRDVERVHMVQSEPYTLGGEIEIDDSRPAAEIYADIYFRCGKAISSGGQIMRFEEALNQGMSWEELLTGPLTRHGHIEDSHFERSNYDVDVVKLISLVRNIPGVKHVKSLCLLDREGQRHAQINMKHADEICPVLAFPKTDTLLEALRLVRGKGAGQLAAPRQSAVQFREQVKLYLRKLEFEHDAFRNNVGNLHRLVSMPRGQYRELAEYSSVGEHTPAIYGINHYGVPSSEPPDVHARARQLKAYLYPFEQLMANYLASLQGIKHLYSIDASLQQTYFAQFLTDTQVPNLKVLYGEQGTPQQVQAVLREQDAYTDRRNRVLDSLLAVYGEVFPADAMRRYDVYHAEDIELHLIDCKIRLLNHLCRLSGNRGTAMHMQTDYWHGLNYASIQHRIQLLCGGSEDAVGRSLIGGIDNDKVRFVGDQRYLEALAQPEVKLGDTTPLARYEGTADTEAIDLPHAAVSPALMKAGVHRGNYSVLEAGDQQGWLCLNVDGERCWPIALKPLDELPRYGQQFMDRLIALSKGCEGFHLLEHLLLRPRGEQAGFKLDPAFHAHRVSVVLPGFTARFADLGCRAWVEEMIAQNLPAHILPTFYWLDFVFMTQFELRYHYWLEMLASVSNGSVELTDRLDTASAQLTAFLASASRHQTNRVWL
jgi:hypothetical protein